MKVHYNLQAGYIELLAETVKECASLITLNETGIVERIWHRTDTIVVRITVNKPAEKDQQIDALRELAKKWRSRAAQVPDPYAPAYIAECAEELDALLAVPAVKDKP